MVGKRGLGILGVLSAIAGLGVASSTQAQPIVGVPHDWQMNFPPAYTPLMEKVESLNDLLLIIISLICAFVAALIIYAVWRFHASRNPVATTTTHNTVIEIAWTVLPILILVIIAIPSFRLLYYGDKATDAAFTVKVTGHQWYWSYEYPDQGNFSIDSRILQRGRQGQAEARSSAPAGGRRGDGDPQGHDDPHHRQPRPIPCTAGPCRASASRRPSSPAASTRVGSTSPTRAFTSANARRSAATTTVIARLRFVWCPSPNVDKWVEQKKKSAGLDARDRCRFRHPSRQPLSASPQER